MSADSSRKNPNRGRNSSASRSRAVPPVDGNIPIKSDRDIIMARQRGREMATEIGFVGTDLTLIATAISELARNIVLYATDGRIALRPIQQGGKKGIVVVAEDGGPGIPDVQRVLEEGYSTSHGLGLGLPGVRRLMDEFEITSEVSRGTKVIVKKWAL